MRLLTLILCLGFMSSCNPCGDEVVCKNGSTTDDGSDCICECDQWYTGDECDTRVTKKFEGTYVGDEFCTGDTEDDGDTYFIEESNAKDNRIIIRGVGGTYYANLTSENQFTIPSQPSTSRTYETVEGSGNLNDGSITMELTLVEEDDNDQVTCDFEGNG